MTTPNEQLIKNLYPLGLDQNDSQVYLALLESGPSRVWDIAKASGVKRPTCYITLDKLVRLGAATKTKEIRHLVFAATPPKNLWHLFEDKRKNLHQSINELETLANKAKDKPTVRMFEGEEGIKQAYNLTLDLSRGSEILFYSRDDIEQKYPDFFHEYLQERVKRGIKARGLFPDNISLMRMLAGRDKLELRQSRFISKKQFDPSADSTVFANKIIHIAYGEKMPFATVIESAALAQDEKQKFELLWALVKKGNNVK